MEDLRLRIKLGTRFSGSKGQLELTCFYNKKSNNVSIKINENSVTSRDEK